MSRRKKLEKFADLFQYPHVYESFEFNDELLTRTETERLLMRGKWRPLQFQNNHPLIVELACGRGEYSLDLARRYPAKNFIGIDIKGARIWKGATIALEEELSNVAFVRARIEQIELFFNTGEIDEIWITFPDPFMRDTQENRRLTAPIFLAKYEKLLNKGGKIHLKTDSDSLYEYSLDAVNTYPKTQLLTQSDNIYHRELPHPDLDILTYYEKQHLADNRTIKYLCFSYLEM